MNRWIYNGTDCVVTRRLHDVLTANCPEQAKPIYRASMALEAPCMAMGLRGMAIDRKAMQIEVSRMARDAELQRESIATLSGSSINPGSPQQLKTWFGNMGVNLTSTDRTHLERLLKHKSDDVSEMARAVLEWRGTVKLKQYVANLPGTVLQYAIRPGGTVSWRFSAQKPPTTVKGLNVQTIPKSLRRIFVPRRGMKMLYADQRQAESFTVAHLSNDPAYIQAHASSDVHTAVAQRIWPDLGWTGKPEKDREIADRIAIRHHSYRQLAKRISHATNYGATEHSHARTLGIKVRDAKRILDALTEVFPLVPVWRERIRRELHDSGTVTYPFGYTLRVAGNRFDADLWRTAVASIPQAVVAWTNHAALMRAWFLLDGPDFHVLVHGHDAILAEYSPRFDLDRLRALLPVHWSFMPAIEWDMATDGDNWYEVS